MSTTDRVFFRSGNTKIIVMENYEALGRYVSASGSATNFARQRDSFLNAIKQNIERCVGHSSSEYIANDFDPEQIQEYLNKAAEAHQNMLAAINEANIHAEACNRGKLKLWK